MESRRPQTSIAQDFCSARGQRLMHAAREVSLFQADVAEHRLRDRDVFRLAPVGRARERQLIVAPLESRVAVGHKKRNELERFRTGAPRRDQVGVSRRRDDVVTNHSGVHAVVRLGNGAARDDDVQ